MILVLVHRAGAEWWHSSGLDHLTDPFMTDRNCRQLLSNLQARERVFGLSLLDGSRVR